MQDARPFDDQVMQQLHEVAAAAREVPNEHQPKRLQDALASLVALEVVASGTYLMPSPPETYSPGA
jgi:hypothetical protein